MGQLYSLTHGTGVVRLRADLVLRALPRECPACASCQHTHPPKCSKPGQDFRRYWQSRGTPFSLTDVNQPASIAKENSPPMAATSGSLESGPCATNRSSTNRAGGFQIAVACASQRTVLSIGKTLLTMHIHPLLPCLEDGDRRLSTVLSTTHSCSWRSTHTPPNNLYQLYQAIKTANLLRRRSADPRVQVEDFACLGCRPIRLLACRSIAHYPVGVVGATTVFVSNVVFASLMSLLPVIV